MGGGTAGVESAGQGASAAPGRGWQLLESGCVARHFIWGWCGWSVGGGSGVSQHESREQIPLGVAAGVHVRWKSRTLEYYSKRRARGWVSHDAPDAGCRPAGRPFDFVVGALSLRDSFSLPAAHPPELTRGFPRPRARRNCYNYAFLQIGQLLLSLCDCWCVSVLFHRLWMEETCARRRRSSRKNCGGGGGILDLHFSLLWVLRAHLLAVVGIARVALFPDLEFDTLNEFGAASYSDNWVLSWCIFFLFWFII